MESTGNSTIVRISNYKLLPLLSSIRKLFKRRSRLESKLEVYLLMRYGVIALLALFALTSTNHVVRSQGATPTDDEVNKIARQLYCPVCENTPLDVCPTEACRQWREEIRSMLADGKSEAEIKQHFVDYYGVRVLNEPPNRWATYFVPAVAVILGALLLFRGFQLWMKPAATQARPGTSEAEPVQQDEYIARLEEELKKRS